MAAPSGRSIDAREPPAPAVDGPVFLRLVAHDLHAPLATARTMLSLLVQGRLGELQPSQADLLRRIEQRLACLQALVDDFMDLQALRAQPATPEPTDICTVARVACSRLEGSARANGSPLALQSTADEVLATIAAADLELALDHLLENAIKYGRGRPILVRVGAEAGGARIVVSDGGIGISEDARARLFEPLYRAPEAMAVAPGSGLGLLIVKEAVERCGGTVDVAGVEGTTVTVWLPLPRDGRAAEARDEAVRPA